MPMLNTDQINQARQAGISEDQIRSFQVQNGGGGGDPAQPEQRGFAGEILPSAFGAVGGMLGAAGGTAIAPGPGTIVGGIAGATAGQAGGEALQQSIEKAYNQRPSYDTSQIASQGITGGAQQLVGGIFAKGAGLGLKVTRPALVTLLSKFSGYGTDIVDRALAAKTTAAAGAVKDGVMRGETALNDVVKATMQKVQAHAKDVLAQSQDFIKSLGNRLPQTTADTHLVAPVAKEMVDKTASDLTQHFRIAVKPDGTLNFDNPLAPSNITTGNEKNAIDQAYQWMKTIPQHPSIEHIDAVLERMIALQGKTPGGTPTGPETKAIIHSMIDGVHSFLTKVPAEAGGGTYADYANHLTDMLPKRVLINDAKDFFGSTAHPSPIDISKTTKKVLQLFNTGNLATRNFVDKAGRAVGTNPVDTAVGTILKTGDNESWRASNLTKRGMIEKLITAVPRAAVRNYVATGKLAGELSKPVRVAAKTLGVTIDALMREVVNAFENNTSNGATGAPAPTAPVAPTPAPMGATPQ